LSNLKATKDFVERSIALSNAKNIVSTSTSMVTRWITWQEVCRSFLTEFGADINIRSSKT
jgi:hypothetical protein